MKILNIFVWLFVFSLAISQISAISSLVSPITVSPTYVNQNNTKVLINFTLNNGGPQEINRFNVTNPDATITFQNVSTNVTRLACNVNSTFLNCTIPIGQANISNGEQVELRINLTTTANANYTFNFTSVDNSSNINYTDKYTLIADVSPPNIYAINSSTISSTCVDVTFTSSDQPLTLPTNGSINYTSNASGQPNQVSNFTAYAATPRTVRVCDTTYFNPGTAYYANITLCDQFKNCNTSQGFVVNTGWPENTGYGGGGGSSNNAPAPTVSQPEPSQPSSQPLSTLPAEEATGGFFNWLTKFFNMIGRWFS